MLNFKSLPIMAAVAILLPSTLATFDASANTNMAVYWGQGPNQKPLKFFCDDENIDIIQIGFVNVFPDQSGGYPGTNFGNQCGSATYKDNGSSSLLLSDCPEIGPDITYCQILGKKVLLSLGGAIPNNSHIDSEASAKDFANFLWEAFGPEDASKTTPRPFGSSVVDGFDFDIENVLAQGEDAGDLNRGYGTMVKTLRTLYEKDSSKTYYVSAAPQCIVPDVHLADAIQNSPFDFLFVQFYNTPQCSARAYFDHSYGGTHTNISFGGWVDFVQQKSSNPNTKVYLGLPAAPDTDVVYDLKMYLQPDEAKQLIEVLQCGYKHEFGGVMIYEATFSQNNQINGQPYADVLKGYLENCKCPASPTVTSSATLHSTPATSSTQAVSTTQAVLTTYAVSTTLTASSVHTPSSSASTLSTRIASSSALRSSSPSIIIGSSQSIVSYGSSTPITTSAGIFTSASGRVPSPSGSSSNGTSSNGSPSSGSYQNATSATGFSAPVSIATSSTPAPVLSGTTTSPVPESTEYTSLTTYTTVTSCPVTTTKVQGGTTSVIVETSVITSTITTCPRCTEKKTSALVPVFTSNTPGSPNEVGTTAPASVPSNTALQSSPSVVPGNQPSPTTYTATVIVSTLTTTCSEATTFSLSSSGKVYTATANETLTISEECPCTLTYKTTGYSGPTNVGSASNLPLSDSGHDISASGFLVGTTHFGTPGSAESKSAPSESEIVGSSSSPSQSEAGGSSSSPSQSKAGGSNSSPHTGSNSPSQNSESSTEGSNGSSSAGSPGTSNAGSQSKSSGGSDASSSSAGSPGAPNSENQSKSSSGSGVLSPGSANKAVVPQQSSPEKSTAQGSPSEAEAAGSVSSAGAQSPASGVSGAHHPVVTIEMIPVPATPSQIAQSGKASQNGQSSGQSNAQSVGQSSGQGSGQQSGKTGQQSGQESGENGQQSGQTGQIAQQTGQQSGQSGQSGQHSTTTPLYGTNGTAPGTPSGTGLASPSGTAPASQSPGIAQSSLQEFKGAASRAGGSLFGAVAAVAAVLLSL